MEYAHRRDIIALSGREEGEDSQGGGEARGEISHPDQMA